MRKAVVPEDMSSEQKSLFGIVSWRQMGYIGAGVYLAYQLLPSLVSLFYGMPLPILLILVIIFGVVIPIGLFLPFAFIRISKYNMFLDKFIITKVVAKYEKGTWRKGLD